MAILIQDFEAPYLVQFQKPRASIGISITNTGFRFSGRPMLYIPVTTSVPFSPRRPLSFAPGSPSPSSRWQSSPISLLSHQPQPCFHPSHTVGLRP